LATTLLAISAGAVFMGANTYIGNAPNFMVRAIAEDQGTPMPSFFGYMLWSGAFLLPLFVLVTLICAIPFIFIVRADPANFTVGYVGSKLKAEGDLPALLVQNIVKALLALHVRGDEIFRSNPPGQPHLDPISGVLFLAGALYWLTDRERRRWAPIWLAPLLLLQVPSIMA
ncbi:MAG: sodium:proton antiporter, partial [Anaerolineae bacterium]